MGLGSQRKRRNIYYANLKANNAQKQLDPHFIVKFKKAGQDVIQKETELSGKLYNIKTDKYLYEGVEQKTIIVQLVDGAMLMQLEVNIDTSMARSIANGILGREPKGYEEVLFLRTYIKKAENNNQYAQIYVGGEGKGSFWDWKWKREEVEPLIVKFYNPKRRKPTDPLPTPGVPPAPNDSDYSEVNKMILAQIDLLGSRINSHLALINKLEGEEEDQPVASGSHQSSLPANNKGPENGPGPGDEPYPSGSFVNPEANGADDDLPF
jgi:hypothetical protein